MSFTPPISITIATNQDKIDTRSYCPRSGFHIFLTYTTNDHKASHAEIYSRSTPEYAKVSAPTRLQKKGSRIPVKKTIKPPNHAYIFSINPIEQSWDYMKEKKKTEPAISGSQEDC